MKVEDYVGKLLYRYDCVIVPGWGGLLSSYKPASIHPDTHIMDPPAKALSFNQLLTNNDGLLTNEVAVGEGCSYDEAAQLIGRHVSAMWNELRAHRSVDWEHIGVFQLGEEHKIIFKAHHKVNYLTHAFGLSLLRSSAIQREQCKTAAATLNKEDPVLSVAVAKILRRRWWRAAAVIVPLAGIAILGWWQRDAVTGRIYAGVLSFTATGPELYEPRIEETSTLTPLKEVKVEDWWAIAHKNATGPIEIPKGEIRSRTHPVAKTTTTGHYHVIAGCFVNEANADRLLARLQARGVPARRIGTTSKGLHIVTYNSYPLRREALKELARIRLEYSTDAWLLQK